MARDPDTIEREIERAREALAGTLDALGQRANPKRLVESGKQTVEATLADPKVRYGLVATGALLVLLVLRRLFR